MAISRVHISCAILLSLIVLYFSLAHSSTRSTIANYVSGHGFYEAADSSTFHFNVTRDERNLGLTDEQCDVSTYKPRLRRRVDL